MGENNNQFRFSLYQEDVLFCEKMFNADLFNPFTRYSIDIRKLLPDIISNFQRVLSKKEYEVNYSIGSGESYDFWEYYKKCTYDEKLGRIFKYLPKIKEYNIDEKYIKGVECKLGLYINENPIVERIFYVNGFNPMSRFSVDVLNETTYATDLIINHIKKSDVENMWDDYDLINQRGLSINQIRELHPHKRSEMLQRLRR